ncbi:VOC family protein [Actinomadura logoneensis]|uniref:VOC family protein n=1 Tax=Actinomadura logoneensis TaxID=2293572 RepID=A0A372JPI5_9ACTN|nr:VOC family protein [Actinomadura logoneensis]RFU41941.1 VOC family protein [Actinomadura logoneensis]
MLRGLTAISFYAKDVAAARDWYAEFLGMDAYFQRPEQGDPAYVEFRVGDYQHELGIIDARYAPPGLGDEDGGAIAYWAVDDLERTWDRLLEMGAVPFEKPTERGPGFVTASVRDPFGNILGIMTNQHYMDVLAGRKG